MPILPLSFPELYILLSFLGSVTVVFSKEVFSKKIAYFFSGLLILVSVTSLLYVKQGVQSPMNSVSYLWFETLGSSLVLRLDGLGLSLSALVSFVVFASIIITPSDIKNKNYYYGLIFFLQLGLYGVFMAYDALVFYIFWEVVLIPVYFLCSLWGGKQAIQPTMKFFIYTFLGSLFMLFAIVYIYSQNDQQLFRWESMRRVFLNPQQQIILFIAFMIAFAIKMPIFPFHTWQPKLYSSIPLSLTVILSAVMVKMGLVGVVRWVIPFFPVAIKDMGIYFMALSIIGVVYASLIAIRQNDLKLVAAYSSIAHIGLMSTALLSGNQIALEGVFIQMFNHGINITGLWLLIYFIEKKYGTTDIKELGGIISQNSFLGFVFIVVAFANIALPLTNSFVGEFPILLGIYSKNMWLGIIGGSSVIVSAVYMLRVVDFSLFGTSEKLKLSTFKLSTEAQSFLIFVVATIFIIGIYPKPLYTILQHSLSLMK